jgi:NAD-dependent dihydropyrimidine dehydrogenase PreA subunit
MASTSESRSGASHIPTDNATECILNDSCISACSKREVEVIPVTHTQQKSDLQWDTNVKFENL